MRWELLRVRGVNPEGGKEVCGGQLVSQAQQISAF